MTFRMGSFLIRLLRKEVTGCDEGSDYAKQEVGRLYVELPIVIPLFSRAHTAVSRLVVQQNRMRQCQKVLWVIGVPAWSLIEALSVSAT